MGEEFILEAGAAAWSHTGAVHARAALAAAAMTTTTVTGKAVFRALINPLLHIGYSGIGLGLGNLSSRNQSGQIVFLDR